MLDFDLAEMYEVTTGNFNKAIKRNIERFPARFMFQLNKDEFNLIFQNGISLCSCEEMGIFLTFKFFERKKEEEKERKPDEIKETL